MMHLVTNGQLTLYRATNIRVDFMPHIQLLIVTCWASLDINNFRVRSELSIGEPKLATNTK